MQMKDMSKKHSRINGSCHFSSLLFLHSHFFAKALWNFWTIRREKAQVLRSSKKIAKNDIKLKSFYILHHHLHLVTVVFIALWRSFRRPFFIHLYFISMHLVGMMQLKCISWYYGLIWEWIGIHRNYYRIRNNLS